MVTSPAFMLQVYQFPPAAPPFEEQEQLKHLLDHRALSRNENGSLRVIEIGRSCGKTEQFLWVGCHRGIVLFSKIAAPGHVRSRVHIEDSMGWHGGLHIPVVDVGTIAESAKMGMRFDRGSFTLIE